MSYTVQELDEALNNWAEKNNLQYDFFTTIWYEEIEALPYLEGFGQVEHVENRGGEGDGAEIWVTIKVGDRYFERSGFYSSWEDDELDSGTYEVKPKQVLRTEYEAI